MSNIEDDLDQWFGRQRARLAELKSEPRLDFVGRVADVGDGVAVVHGLPHTRLDELLFMEGGTPALAVQLERNRIGCMLLGPAASVHAGDLVRGSGEVIQVPVGPEMLGRVVDPLGRPLDAEPAPQTKQSWHVDRPAPSIFDRQAVRQPLQTGILSIDSMIPVGRGQRELIIGDRKTGKTTIAIDTVINQRDTDVVCVYAIIGQKASTTRRIIEAIQTHGEPSRVCFVVGQADAPPAMQWLTAYSACTIAEYFRDNGQHALLILDDLTKQADIYRELSLLLRRPPGREAYPGDIFYIQSRLLERAAKLDDDAGAGSLTALPIAETQAGNISAYIPTNLISITDGQIYLDPELFNRGQKPAVDIGRSVSRVGGKTQLGAMRELSSDLRLQYTQFLELEAFTRFGVEADPHTRQRLERGRRIRALLSQPQYRPLRTGVQLAMLMALAQGLLDGVPVARIGEFREACRERLPERCPQTLEHIEATGKLDDADRDALLAPLRVICDRLSGHDEADHAPG